MAVRARTAAQVTLGSLLPERDGAIRVLALGAHPDDVEIGAGGTVLRLLGERSNLVVDIAILTGTPDRRREAEASARSLVGERLGRIGVRLLDFRDGFLPMSGPGPKEEVERLKEGGPYDVVLCPSLNDAHQDHRHTAELAWQTFRGQPILEYEVPKYEGIGEQANLFVELTEEQCRRKIDHLLQAFPSQAPRSWYSEETFWSMLRLRGVESASPTGYAEAFICRKLRV